MLPNKQRGEKKKRIIQVIVVVFGISIIQNFHKQNKNEAILQHLLFFWKKLEQEIEDDTLNLTNRTKCSIEVNTI